MTTLPEPTARQPHAPTAGQPTPDTLRKAAALDLAAAVDAIYHGPTFYKDHTKPPAIGDAQPVPQPGRPPMSEAATNISGVMIASSVPILALGAAGTGIVWASGYADPTVIGLICAAPAALAIPILALSRLAKRTKEVVQAAPPVHNHTYTGTVVQNTSTVNSSNTGVWVRNRNELPR